MAKLQSCKSKENITPFSINDEQEKNNLDLQHQFDEKPRVIPGCPGTTLQTALVTHSVKGKSSGLQLLSVSLFYICVKCVT